MINLELALESKGMTFPYESSEIYAGLVTTIL